MLRKTLIFMALSCLAFAAYSDWRYDHWFPKPKYPHPRQKGSIEGLEISRKTGDVWLQIKVGNDSDGYSKVEVVDILSYVKDVNIHCLNNSVDYRVVVLDRKAEYGRADFNTADLKDCDEANPDYSDIHIECDFDGENKLDITMDYKEEMPDGKTAGHSRIRQASATCTVTVTGDGTTSAFEHLGGGELTTIQQYSK